MSVENTLAEREARYGSFIKHAEIAQGLQAVIQRAPNWSMLDYDMRQALVTITDKIARILNGDPFYGDNWHDIQGYAKLVEDRILALQSTPETIFDEDEDLGAPRPAPNGVVSGSAMDTPSFVESNGEGAIQELRKVDWQQILRSLQKD